VDKVVLVIILTEQVLLKIWLR